MVVDLLAGALSNSEMAATGARLIGWTVAGVAAAGMAMSIAAGDDAVTAQWTWRAPWRAVRALISDQPWDWVERFSWLVAIAVAGPGLFFAARALKAAGRQAEPGWPTADPVSTARDADDGLASVRVPLVQPGGAFAGADSLVLGRDRLLDDLRSLTRRPGILERLRRPRRQECRVVVLHGGGGVGKSTVAWRLSTTVPDDTVVWWVSATSPEQLRSQLREVAATAGATDAQLQRAWSGQRDPADLLWAVLTAFPQGWLLVIDDADSPQHLAGSSGRVADGRGWLRPPVERGLVVVTTRDADRDQWGPWCRLQHVGRLGPDDAGAVLRTLAPHAGTAAEARTLAIRLDGLPLALRLAGSYLQQTARSRLPGAATTFTAYLGLYQQTVESSGTGPGTEPALGGIRQSIEVSLHLLDLRGATRARVLLQILAQFALAPVSVGWLDTTILARHAELDSLTIPGLQGLLNGLQKLDLIIQTNSVISLHQHIHDANHRPYLADPSWPVAAALIGEAIHADHDLYDPAGWPRIDAVAPHLFEFLKRDAYLSNLLPASITVAARIVIGCLIHRVILPRPAALPLVQRNLAAQRRLLADDHRETLRTRNLLAFIVHLQDGLNAAEPEFRAVLEAQQRLFGDDDRDTLRTRHNLAVLLRDRGDLDAAEPEFRAVLEARRRLFGDDDRETLNTRENLAVVLRDRGDLDAAEPEFRAVLEAQQRLFGDDDRDTLRARNNLAVVLLDRGDFDAAEPEFRAVLEARERLFGDDDRDTLRTRENLAVLLRRRKQSYVVEG